MTIKNIRKNISAENEYVLTNASLNENTGILTISKKNLYDDTDGTIVLNLNDLKLRLILLENVAALNTIKNSSDPNIIKQKHSHIYLVPFSESDVEEGIYRECIWVESKQDFEVIGSTKTDLDPLKLDISRLKQVLDFEVVTEGQNVIIKSNRLDDIEDDVDYLYQTKAERDHVHGNVNNDGTIINAPSKNVVTNENGVITTEDKYVHPTPGAITGKPTANQSPGFGGYATVSQIKTNNEGHVTSATDRRITIPSTTANSSTNGLAKATSTAPSDIRLDNAVLGTDNNEFARSDHAHKHPTGLAKVGNPTASQTSLNNLDFGDSFTVTQFSSNATGHISQAADKNIKIPKTMATTSTDGLMSAEDKAKLDGIEAGAGHVDAELNPLSLNPVQNKVICEEFYTKEDIIELLNGIETSRGKLLTIYLDEETGDLVIDDDGFTYYTDDEVDEKFTVELVQQVTADNTDYATYVVKQGNVALEPKIRIPKNISAFTNDSNYVQTNDTRLSDARTPLSHDHGNIKNDGTIGTTANKPLITTTSGKVTTGSFESNTSNIKMNGSVSVGLSNNFARSDHIHPSDTTKVDTAGTGLSKNGTTLNHSNNISAQTSSVFKKIQYDSEGHITGTSNVSSSDLPSHNHSVTNITNTERYDNIKDGESTTLTLTNQKLINDAISQKLGQITSFKFIEITSTKPTASVSTLNKLYIVEENNKVNVYYTEENIDVQNGNTYTWHKMDADILDELNITWNDISGKPSSYEPSSHTHASDDISGLAASKNVCTNANGKLSTENKNNHSHGSLASGGTLNSDASTVNKIAVTDGSNNLKTTSSLDNTKIIEANALGTIGTNQNANQHTINTAINDKLNNIVTGGVDLSGTHTHEYNQIDDLYDYNTGNNLLPYTKAFNIPAPTGSSINGVYRDCNVRYLQNTTSSYIDFAWTVPQSVLKPDTYYTISFWAKTSNEHEYFIVYFYNGNNQTTLRQKSNSTISGQETAVTSAHDGSTRFHLTTEWKRYYVVYKLNSTSITAGKQISLRLSPNTSINPDIYLAGVKLEIGDAPTPYCEMEIEDSGSEFIVGTQTESTGSWTGISNTIYQLQKGTRIYYKLPYAGSGNATLNLTLANGETTGAKECYYNNTTRLSTQYGVNSIIELVFDGSYWRSVNPYSNYIDRIYQSGQITMGEATATNILVGGKTDGKYYKIVSGGVYDIRYQIYWTNGAFAINSVQSNIYSIFNSINLQSTVSGLTVTNNQRVYIECSHYANGQYIVSDRVFVSDDNLRVGYYYIPIGMSHSTTNIRFNTFTTDIYICESFGLKPYVEDDYLQSNFYLTDDLQLYVKGNNYYRSYTDGEDGLNDLLKPTNKTLAELELTNTGLKINSSTSSEKWFFFPVVNPNELQFTYVSGQLRGWLLGTFDGSGNAICSGDCQSNTSYGIFISGTRTAYTGTALASGDIIRVTFNNGVVSYYRNNVLIGSKEYDNSNDEVYCGFYTNNGRNLVVKDVIIK